VLGPSEHPRRARQGRKILAQFSVL